MNQASPASIILVPRPHDDTSWKTTSGSRRDGGATPSGETVQITRSQR